MYWPLVFAKHIPVWFGLISLVMFFVAEFAADKLARKRQFADRGIQVRIIVSLLLGLSSGLLIMLGSNDDVKK